MWNPGILEVGARRLKCDGGPGLYHSRFDDQATAHIEYPALQRVSDSPDEGCEDVEDCNCKESHRALHWPAEVSVSAPWRNDSSNTTD